MVESLEVLERHPGLRVCFAHFFFLSAQLGRLADILERFPQVVTDLTPGIEMYENFSRTPEETRAFFERFHDRILYGTDIGSRFVYHGGGRPFNEKENLRRPEIVRAFLTNREYETVSADGNFVVGRPDFAMMGLGLEGERLREILGGNYLPAPQTRRRSWPSSGGHGGSLSPPRGCRALCRTAGAWTRRNEFLHSFKGIRKEKYCKTPRTVLNFLFVLKCISSSGEF